MLKATLRSLLGRPLRLLMSITAVMLGVAFVAGTFIFTDTLDRSFTSIFASAVGDVVVSPVGGQTADGTQTDKTVPSSLVDELAGVPGAARADGIVDATGVYIVQKNGKLIGGLGAPALAGNTTDAPSGHGLEGLVLLEGSEPVGPDQVVMDEVSFEKSGYQIGDRITLATSLADNATMHPTLVGTIGYRSGGSLNGASFVAFDTPSAQQIFLGSQDVFSKVWVTAADGVSQDQLKAEVQKVLPAGFEAQTGDEAAEELGSGLKSATGFLKTFLLIFAFIALAVGVFLIINTFLMLVAQRTREMGLMRALGASRWQVSGSVVLEASAMGLFGGLLGLGAGFGLAKLIMFAFSALGLDITSQPTIITVSTVVYSLGAGLVTTVVAAAIPAWKAGRVSPLTAMRDDATIAETPLHRLGLVGGLLTAGGVVALVLGLYVVDSRQLWWVGGGVAAILLGVVLLSVLLAGPFANLFALVYRRTSGVVGNLAAENARRNPLRTTITAAALMVGLTLVSTIAIMGASAKQSVADQLEQSFAGDLVVSNIAQQPFSTSVGDIAESLDGVQTVSRLRFVILGSGGPDSVLLPAIDPATFSDVVETVFDEGSLSDLTPGTFAISADYADKTGLGVGDQLTVPLPAGDQKFRISGIYETNALANSDYVTSLATLESLGFPPADNVVYIVVRDGVDPAVVQKQLEDRTTDLPMVTIKDQAGFVQEQVGLFNIILNLMYGLLGLAIVIAVLGVVNTLALSVIERTREVGLLRAIGLDRKQLRRAIRLESVLISVYGGVLGTAMGVLFGVALITAVSDEGLSTLVLPWGQIIGVVVATAVVGVLAAVWPARRAAKQDVLQAIATE